MMRRTMASWISALARLNHTPGVGITEMKRILICSLMLAAGAAIAGFPVDPRLMEAIVPVAEFRDANPIDTINCIVCSVLSTNVPKVELWRAGDAPKHPAALHSSMVVTVDRSTVSLVSLTRTNITAYALIQTVAEAGNLTLVFTNGKINIGRKADSNTAYGTTLPRRPRFATLAEDEE